MCSRHAAHLIAEYEAARLASTETSETNDASDTDTSDPESSERAGVLATVVAWISR